MNNQLAKHTEILVWDPETPESYWKQCHAFDRRPFDTHSIMSSSINQVDSQQAFAKLLIQFSEKRELSLFD